ncbi:DMT family transporter [Anabaena sp. FACHB-1237]|uniref:DMT family transporter n=1 Tax=Anabaena sp. FACHB-1237 TaxID=2692769 RepID=UPI001681020D|nr:DMT family transporter [Anabaena sp. FACHB-1237]MBD2136866.1 DMT family transporter [Anabaena sp. FACHB-1237]
MQLEFKTSRSTITSLLLIAPFFLWGTAMVAMKGVIPHTTPLFMAGVRLVPAGILILIAAAFMGRKQPQGLLAWLWITLFAIVDGTLFQGFLAEGLVRTSAGLGSVMIDSQPLAVALLSWWLFQEHIGLWGWIGLALGVIGISLIGIPDEIIVNIVNFSNSETLLTTKGWEQLLTDIFTGGEWLMLLAALSMAVGTVMIRFVCRYADPVVATGWHCIIAGLPLWLMSYVWETQQWQNILPSNWLALSYATIFGSAIAYGLFFYFAQSGNLTSLSSLTFLTPIFALIFGHIFLTEVLTNIQWLGVIITLISIYLINQRENLLRKNNQATINDQSVPENVLGKPTLLQNTSTNQISKITVNMAQSQSNIKP